MSFTEGFESGVTGWTPASATFVQSTSQHHSGTHAGLLTVTGSPAQAYVRHDATVAGDQMCSLDAWVYSTPGIAHVGVFIDWYDAANVYISTSSSDEVTLTAATWTHITLEDVSAPDNAVTARFGPLLDSNPATGAALFVDDVTLKTVTITAAADSGWPPRVVIAVTDLNIGDSVTVYRIVGGVFTAVRRGHATIATDVSLVLIDGEFPFGVPTVYLAEVNLINAARTASMTTELPGGKVVLSDAVSGLAVETVISAWASKDNQRNGTKMIVGGRTVFVSAPRGDSESSVEFVTEAESSRQNMIALLDGATESIILMRQPGGYDGVDGWYYVNADNEARAAQNGKLERRLWTLDLVESSGWAPELLSHGSTYADLEAVYDGQTYADLEGDFDTYLDVAIFDWEGAL